MRKNNPVLPAVYLSLICLITTGLVALTFSLTQPARDMQAQISANANRRLVVPEAADFVAIELDQAAADAGLTEAYKAVDEDGQTIAWLLVAGTRGYGGQIPVMLAINPDLQISGIKVLKNDETPGLGKKVAESFFISQYLNQGIEREFVLSGAAKDQVGIDSVAGATISSNAVNSAVGIAVDYFKQNIAEVIAHGS